MIYPIVFVTLTMSLVFSVGHAQDTIDHLSETIWENCYDPLDPEINCLESLEEEIDALSYRYIRNIKEFLERCPTNDPAYQMIRSDFKIRRNGIEIGDIDCTEPISEMLPGRYSDELILLQGLRVIYYMDLGQSGHLPWTQGTLYEWMKSKIGGINIKEGDSHCCEEYEGKKYIGVSARDNSYDWKGISGNIGVYAHETRHIDGC